MAILVVEISHHNEGKSNHAHCEIRAESFASQGEKERPLCYLPSKPQRHETRNKNRKMEGGLLKMVSIHSTFTIYLQHITHYLPLPLPLSPRLTPHPNSTSPKRTILNQREKTQQSGIKHPSLLPQPRINIQTDIYKLKIVFHQHHYIVYIASHLIKSQNRLKGFGIIPHSTPSPYPPLPYPKRKRRCPGT